MSASIARPHRLCGCETIEKQKFDVNLFESLMDKISLDEAFKLLYQDPSASPSFLHRFLLAYADAKEEIVSLVILELCLSLQLSNLGLIEKVKDPLSFGSLDKFFICISQERFSPFDEDGKLPASDEVIESKLTPEQKFIFILTLNALLEKYEQFREINAKAVVQTLHSLLNRLDTRVKLPSPKKYFQNFSKHALIANLGNQTSSLLQQITYFEPLSRKAMIELFQPCKELMSLWEQYNCDPLFSEFAPAWKKVIDQTLVKIEEVLENKEQHGLFSKTCPGADADKIRYPKTHLEQNIAFLKTHLISLFCAESEFDEPLLKETIGYLNSLLKQCQKLSYIESLNSTVKLWQRTVRQVLPTIENRTALIEAKYLSAAL